jgi:hypothetical protein
VLEETRAALTDEQIAFLYTLPPRVHMRGSMAVAGWSVCGA